MSQLFSPLKLGELTLDNRIIIAPMCQYSANQGSASDWHTIHLGQLSLSGAGLLILEATAVSPEGRISYADLGLWNNETQQALGKSLKALRQYSPMPIGIQLAHAGRKASTEKPWDGGGAIAPSDENGWQTLAPSAIAYDDNAYQPKAMTKSDITQLINDFVSAAKRADELGLDLIELHGAHGYLLHQFLSPLSNKRDDEYGGSLQNRMRLVLEVFKAVRAEFASHKPVGIRISATDWVEGGWDLAQSIELAKALDKLGCDFIHVSTAGLSPEQQIPVKPNFQVPFATAIKEVVSMPVIAVGLITEPQQGEDIISEQQADGVALARGILYNPHWPWHAAAQLGATVNAPKQYLRSSPHGQPSPIK
ncbi:NADH:flavin oxidoreductase/NADH oxidase [Pseudoalteromonas sp. Angola-4]|uniref:NADH:flavin oxidoreductase/NADH oxidase n=1 Tax=Pseudoalteromonas sp. Angola-4 TaxID=3025335 RepID=UPI00235A3A7D|nr:NADH:flavin oxidoreductase/NADH oxidase [Pseudoalteromonas sp. Angola-4]MDC9511127.1 NADH:flavin oxidoreductase/NADH oxidase [Pseudoalteromonas sp. Angola-4]